MVGDSKYVPSCHSMDFSSRWLHSQSVESKILVVEFRTLHGALANRPGRSTE